MGLYQNIAIIITLTVFLSYLNHRFIKIQTTLAIMMTSLIISIVLLFSDRLGFHIIHDYMIIFVGKLKFHDLLVNCMLGILLFAGALTIDLSYIKKQKFEIGFLATIGVIFSTVFIGFGACYLFNLFGINIDLKYCLLFGALISPTDPVAILSALKDSKAPKKIESVLAVESLLNDGIAVVLFITLYDIAFSGSHLSLLRVSLQFLHASIGGVGFGFFLSFICYFLIKSIDDHKIVILITIAIVTGGYVLAQAIEVSGPLAMVVVGIYIANHKREIIISKNTREHLESFWELIDILLNAILFLLVGFELLLVHYSYRVLITSVVAIVLVLVIRYITVAITFFFIKKWRNYPNYTIFILTWSGLRGGVAIALALALPVGSISDIFLPTTYAVVIFSLLVQGLTIKPLLKYCKRKQLEKKN